VLDAGSRNRIDRMTWYEKGVHLLLDREDLRPICFNDFRFVDDIYNFLINGKISDTGQVIYI
jgi:hypothetical protein